MSPTESSRFSPTKLERIGSTFSTVRDSIVVSISACHADDPGSIPGRGVFSRENTHISNLNSQMQYSDAGTRTRVAWVKARYPNQLDYIGTRLGTNHVCTKIRRLWEQTNFGVDLFGYRMELSLCFENSTRRVALVV